MGISKDYEWFVKADLSRYKGKYVLIKNKKVVGSGESLNKIIAEFKRKHPQEKLPTIAKIPKDELLILVII